MKIDICICTFRRPSVTETLQSVDAAHHPDGAVIRLIVIDNDDRPTARGRVAATAADMALPVRYFHVPGGNISIARNAALDAANGDWIVFLDDDERVDRDWLIALLERQHQTGADAVFGCSRAEYGPGAAGWIVNGDFHSQSPVERGGVIETGHTCNALLRWGAAPWRQQRFDPGRGRSGGEDTEFFFRLRRLGACYAIADSSIVREAVPAARQSLRWLLRRRFRIGQSYAASALSYPERVRLLALAAMKSGYCILRAGLVSGGRERRAFWLLRGVMHAGICAGCLKWPQRALYGVHPR
ncbi:MAG: glycosyltransferase family 2 protein [Thalassovita sp.]|nr:glycosyltransferase family 2 protein [Thalassovita sp.]